MLRTFLAGALLLLAGCTSRGDAPGSTRAVQSTSSPGAPPAPAAAPAPGAAGSPLAHGADAPTSGLAQTTLLSATASPAVGSAADTPETRRPYRADIPRAPLGAAKRTSILDGKQGEGRVVDEESDSVARGRRIVSRQDDDELSGTFASADELAQAILDALAANEPAPLHALHITREEFEKLFWPEFPQSRPATGIDAADAWGFHDAACRDGISEGLSKWGGQSLHLQHVRYDVGFAPYTNFNLYHGVVIQAVDDRGVSVDVPIATVFAERKGRWKAYMFNS